jgi:DNA-directed RNA polymerase specialized sigma subunit
MSEHIETRRKVKEIADISSFNNLLNSIVISCEDKLLLEYHYLQNKDFKYIGDMLGYSESTIKKRHRKILKKISKIL